MTLNPEDLLLHADFVRSLARALISDEHHAEDLAQEVYLAALKRPPSSEKPLGSWLSRVARNLKYSFLRNENRRLKREKIMAKSYKVPSPQEIVELEEARKLVVNAVLEQYNLGSWTFIESRPEFQWVKYWFGGERVEDEELVVRSFYRTNREDAIAILQAM